jgi:hypothetical protein
MHQAPCVHLLLLLVLLGCVVQEQQSFSYSKEQYMQRLEYVAAALVAWGCVTTVQTQLTATKERPRVGKAVSIMLDVPEDKAREWIAL